MGPQTLGDIDGDGDVDLLAAWSRSTSNVGPEHWGWTVAFNNGRGEFVSVRERQVGPTTGSPRIQGGDFDGDGLLDLAVTERASAELLHNQGKDGFETVLQLFDAVLFGLADGDGDGDVDLLVHEFDDESSHVVLWRNDGAAGFVRSDRFVLDTEERLFPQLLAGQSLGEAVRLLWTRPCYLPQGAWQLTRPWEASEEPPLFFEAEVNPCTLQLLVDLDGDGAMELVGSLEERRLLIDTYHGLAVWRLDASGGVSRHPLLGSQVHVSPGMTARDLNGDGLLDLALVDGNLATGPALVVLVGQRDGLPVVEGRYTGYRARAAPSSLATSTATGQPIWSCWGGTWKAVRAEPSSFSTRIRQPPPSPPRPRPPPQPLSSVPTTPTRSIRPRPSPWCCPSEPRRSI